MTGVESDTTIGSEKFDPTIENQIDSDLIIDENGLIAFKEDSSGRPLNWPLKKKAMHVAFYGITTLSAQYNSSAMSPVVPHLMKSFDISQTVAILSTSLYVLGVAFGPMLFAPFSEVYGRKPGVLIPFGISGLFTLGAASSKNIAALLCTRFFAGLFASAPVVSSGGVLADMFLPTQRGTSLVFYSYFVVCGTTLSPLVSAALTQHSETAWQWAEWLPAIMIGVALVADVLLLSETYVPVLLVRRAKRMRLNTQKWHIHAKHEEWQLTLDEFLKVHLARPFAMLATPIVFCIALLASYVFGLLYLVITSISKVFKEERGWNNTVSQLPLIGLTIGVMIGGIGNVLGNKRYTAKVAANGGKSIPEERFPVMMILGWLFPAGIFIFSWTADNNKIHWFVPILGIVIMGIGFLSVFQGCLNYLVDAFTRYSASAIAANTFSRSLFGAAFPLFGHYLFDNLGVNWGGSLIGFIGLGLIPIPFVFYFFGKTIRAKNPYINLVS